MADGRLDMVIFGATGFTGKYVVKNATHMCKEQKMKFGVAGRRKEALEAGICLRYWYIYGLELIIPREIARDVSIILADMKDEESLKKMTERAKVLVNCCGPYRFYGEPVIKACIATRTHYVDVSAEEEFMERMQLEYNEAAQEAGVYIVSACGFDCIPCDLGIIFTQQKFGGEVNTVEVYVEIWLTGTHRKGPYTTYTSWECLIHNLVHARDLRDLRAKLYPTKLPEYTPKLNSKGMLHRSDVSEGCSLPFPSADRSVALRTQRFLYDKYKERPAQVQTYITVKYFFDFLAFVVVGMILFFMSRTAYSRNILLKYSALFSCGFASHESPRPETLNSMNFSIMFKAHGWTEKLAEPTDKHTDPPNKKVITKVSGVSPAYEATSILTILSAFTILNEADRIPDNGGVLTPGAAFGKTFLIDQMNEYNIKFEVISSTEQ